MKPGAWPCSLLVSLLLAGCAGPGVADLEGGRHMAALPLASCQPDGLDGPPVFVRGTAPHLPMFDPDLPRLRVIEVVLAIDAQGAVREARMAADEGKFYIMHIQAAAAQWSFTPAMRGGQAVAAECTLRLKVDLRRRPEHLSYPNGWR